MGRTTADVVSSVPAVIAEMEGKEEDLAADAGAYASACWPRGRAGVPTRRSLARKPRRSVVDQRDLRACRPRNSTS